MITKEHIIEENKMDKSLVLDIQNGDKKAFEKIVKRHKQMAFQVALGMTGNRDDAHDISQEAFIRVYKSANKFDANQPFLPWFYTIISNLSKTWIKRRQIRRSRNVEIDNVAHLLVAKDNPETNLHRKEIAKKVSNALLKLSFADREIISLQHIRGMSYDEISSMLNIPRGTVMSRLYYARKKLAKMLGEYSGVNNGK